MKSQYTQYVFMYYNTSPKRCDFLKFNSSILVGPSKIKTSGVKM